MPQIPSYERQVSQTAEPTVQVNENAPIEMFGGGAAQRGAINAAEGLAKQSADLFQQHKDEADTAWVMGQAAEATRLKNQTFYGTPDDPGLGAFAKKGMDALTVSQVYGENFKKKMDEIESGASNPQQRAMFAKIRQSLEADVYDGLQKHTFGETEKLKVDFAKSAADASEEDAVFNHQDPAQFEKAIKQREGALYQAASLAGLHGPIADVEVHKGMSQTYAKVLDRKVTMGDTSGAKKMYDDLVANKMLTPKDAEAVGGIMKVAVLKNESQAAADEIIGKGHGLGAALDEVNVKFKDDAELRDETRQRVKQHFADKRMAQEEGDRNRFDAASDILEKSKGQADIPPSLLAHLPSDKIRALEVRRAQLKAGVEAAPNSDEYYNLMTMASTPATREKFLRTNLTEYRGKIAPSELSGLIKAQGDLRQGKGGDDKLLTGYRTTQDIVTGTLKELKLDKNEEQSNNFRRYVDAQVMAFKQRSGKEPSSEDVQRIVDIGIMKGEDPNSGFFGIGNGKRLFQVQSGQEFEFTIDDIPKSERAKIEAALTRRKLPVTNQRIMQLYGQRLKGIRLGQ